MAGSFSDDKRKHLEFIQGVINRLSSNTFLFKGWSVTIIVAVFSAMITTGNYELVWVLLGSIIVFWSIDAYYLMLERAYRSLYDDVVNSATRVTAYSMNIKKYIGLRMWLRSLTRPVLLMFYGSILLVVLFVIFFNYRITINVEVTR